MALTPEQTQELLKLKAQGLSKEQAYARVFRNSPTISAPQGRFSDVGQDIVSAVSGVGTDLVQRRNNITDSFRAGIRGEQTPIETGMQTAGNALGALGDVAFRGYQAAATPFMSQQEEDKVAGVVDKVAQPVSEKISTLSPRTQRNLQGGAGILEAATGGLPSFGFKPLTSRLKNIFTKGAEESVPTPRINTPQPGVKEPSIVQPTAPRPTTPEQVVSQVEQTLKQEARNPNLSPQAQEAAANAALTFKEKYIGLTPDVKSRLGQMGPEKLQEYLDAAHMRNIDDSVPTPYEVGAQNVNSALEQLDIKLRDTGSDIGQARQKLANVKVPVTAVESIEDTFYKELDKLNLTPRGGQIYQKPGTISKTGSASDINALQKLYGELLVFKQSPTLQNAIDLRMAFDATIKFGKSAREVSNSVDPVSRSVRKAIADEAAKVVGKSNAAELKRYSDFMEAYGDLKSYTDRAAGGEYLLRLVLSGRGGDARKLIETVKEYTGTDLMNDATAMKVATQVLGNENTQNLFKQEVTRAGYDAATVLSGSPTGIIQVVGQKMLDYGIDAEEVLKKAAAGGAAATGAYLLMQENPEFALPIGFAVASVNPSVRKEVISRMTKLVDDATVGEMQDFVRIMDEGGVVTNNKGELVFKEIEGLSQRQVQRAFDDGLRLIEIDRNIMRQFEDTTPGGISTFYKDVIKDIESISPTRE